VEAEPLSLNCTSLAIARDLRKALRSGLGRDGTVVSDCQLHRLLDV